MTSWSRPSDGVLAVPGRDPVSRFALPHGSLRRARPASSYTRCQTYPAPGPTTGPWDDPSREWPTMPVSSRGPRRRRSWWCHTPLINPQHPNPCEASRVIRCGLQARLDMGPHSVPRGCQLSSQSCNGGSREAQLSARPADRPHTHTRPGCTHPRVMLQKCHRLAGGFAAYPSAFVPSDPRWNPGPGCVDHLHHNTPVTLCDHPKPGQPAQWSQDSMSSTRALGVRAALIRWKPSKPTSRSHRSQRSSDTEQQQVG